MKKDGGHSRMMHGAFEEGCLGLTILKTGNDGVVNDGLSIWEGVLVFQRETLLLANV
jgi:hypothetical protein